MTDFDEKSDLLSSVINFGFILFYIILYQFMKCGGIMQARIECIREKIRNKDYRFSAHCIIRMGQRKIWKNDALDAILFGELLEVQEPTKDSPDTHFLFQENSQSPEFCVVVAESEPIIEIITVFHFNEVIWEFNGIRYQRRAKQ